MNRNLSYIIKKWSDRNYYYNIIKYLVFDNNRKDPFFYSLSGYHYTKSIFFHIPKTAGVSVSQSLYNSLGIGHRNYHYISSKFSKEQIEAYFKFCFVREPLDRFLSTINYLLNGGMAQYEFSKNDLYFLSKYGKDFNINEFIYNDLELEISNTIHFHPQLNFILDQEGHIAVDFIGKFENIDKDFAYVKNKLEIRADLVFKNSSRKIIYTKNDLSKKAIELLKSYYRIDFEAFNYPF